MLCSLFILLSPLLLFAQDNPNLIKDITQLNPVLVDEVICPKTNAEIIMAVKSHEGPIAVGGGRYSMGGQTATEKALQIDMRCFDSVLSFSPATKEICVQTGITWRKIQELIDPYDLSVKIMQTYTNFTVGGSLSVNVHGRYVGLGPLILSVKEIKIVLADGSLVVASPGRNKEIFYAAIGAYGGIGVITEATLSLSDNIKLERHDTLLRLRDYESFFKNHVQNDSNAVFHNADIYPKKYNKTRAITYSRTTKPLTIPYRLKPNNSNYKLNRFVFKIISGSSFGKWARAHVVDPILLKGNPVQWRNYEASYDVRELEPKSRKKTTYALQEYFVPESEFDHFYPLMIAILKKQHVNILNISIRHAIKDPGSLLAWAKTDVCSFVLYYKQGTNATEQQKVQGWAREIIDAAISCKGTYYLPYQIHATEQQFAQAYPNAKAFFELKKRLDPSNKFRNKLWDAYYHPLK